MAILPSEHELIQKFLDRSLSQGEKETFEGLKASSEEFSDEVKLQVQTIAALRAKQKAMVREEIASMVKESDGKKSNAGLGTKIHFLYKIAAAVSLVAIVGLPLYYQAQLSASDANQLFSSYYEVFPSSVVTRHGTDNTSHLDSALLFYQAAEFPASIPHFEKIIKEKSAPAIYKIYLGIAYLEAGKLEASTHILSQVENEGDEITTQHAEWYIALVYLKGQNKKATKKQLQQITQKGGLYEMKAKELLSHL